MIEGALNALTEAGFFTGWLRDADNVAPACIQIRQGGTILAQAAAQEFRPDVLQAGHGHGHYGFTARLSQRLPPGPAAFELFYPKRQFAMLHHLPVPRIAPGAPVAVEALLAPHAAWAVDDLGPHLDCLNLPEHLRAWGSARFVDACFRFALQRWPSAAESEVYQRALDDEKTAPDALVAELLGGRERADIGRSLLSPWDDAFPFTLPPQGKT